MPKQNNQTKNSEYDRFARMTKNLISVSNADMREKLSEEAKRKKTAPKHPRKKKAE